ncbi:MAG TPA: CBS domain-containing protein [Gemmatimonadales bacterium]
MSTGRICSRVVVTASPTETVRTAALRMAENDVGTLVVVSGDDPLRAIGIVTDRDIAVRCVAAGLDSGATPISQVMTTPVHSIDENTPIEQALDRMASTATRRLVVTGEAHRPLGILSVDDVIDLISEEAASIGSLLKRQRPHVRA